MGFILYKTETSSQIKTFTFCFLKFEFKNGLHKNWNSYDFLDKNNPLQQIEKHVKP